MMVASDNSAHGDHTTILRKRSDPFERFTEPGPLPVGQELLLVKPRPLEYQSLSATRELSGVWMWLYPTMHGMAPR